MRQMPTVRQRPPPFFRPVGRHNFFPSSTDAVYRAALGLLGFQHLRVTEQWQKDRLFVRALFLFRPLHVVVIRASRANTTLSSRLFCWLLLRCTQVASRCHKA